MRITWLAIIGGITLAWGAVPLATPVAVAQDRGVLDPETVLQDLIDAYREGPTRDAVRVVAKNEARTQEETIRVTIDPAGRAMLELGDAGIWITPDDLYVLLDRDERGFYQAPRDELGVIELLRRELPPVPIPQLALAFDPREPNAIDLMEYASGIEWVEAFIDAGADRRDLELEQDDQAEGETVDLDREPTVILRGEGARTDVTLEMDPETSRLRRMIVLIDEGVTRIELEVSPEIMPSDASWTPSLERREREVSLSLLRPRLGSVYEGDAMPELKLSWELEPDAPIEAPGMVLLFRHMNPSVASALAAARAERDAQPNLGLWSALVIDPTLGQLNFRFADAVEWITPDEPYYTISATNTIDRFGSGAHAILIVFDASNTVRTILDLGPAQPDVAYEERAQPIDERVEELRASIRAALE